MGVGDRIERARHTIHDGVTVLAIRDPRIKIAIDDPRSQYLGRRARVAGSVAPSNAPMPTSSRSAMIVGRSPWVDPMISAVCRARTAELA
jgi:hypothetical protein